ncbi:hypothetical protein D3C85_1551380 [compost metagenome]
MARQSNRDCGLRPEKLSSSSWFGHMKSATAAASSSRKSLTSAGTLHPFSGWPITGSHRYSALGLIDLIRATPVRMARPWAALPR